MLQDPATADRVRRSSERQEMEQDEAEENNPEGAQKREVEPANNDEGCSLDAFGKRRDERKEIWWERLRRKQRKRQGRNMFYLRERRPD